LAVVWLENYFNNIRFYKRHTSVLSCLVVVYLSINILISLNIKPVYSAITWKNTISYVYCILALIFMYGHFFVGVYYYQKVKLPIIKKNVWN